MTHEEILRALHEAHLKHHSWPVAEDAFPADECGNCKNYAAWAAPLINKEA